MAIEGDGARKAVPVRVKRLAKEGLGCSDSAIAPQQEIDRLSVLIDGSIQIVPLPADRNIRLVRSPRAADAAAESVPTLLKLWYKPQSPSEDRRVHDADTALGHHLDQVAVGEAIADVPAHAKDDNLGVEPSLSIDPVSLNRFRHSAAPC